MLGFCACDRIEPSTAHNSVLRIIGIAECAEDATKVSFQPKCLGCFTFLAAFVNCISFYASGDLDFDAHINAREGIVATAETPGFSVSDQCTDSFETALRVARTSKFRW